MKRLQVIRHDASAYDRPNQDWQCGHAAEGNGCRIGPGSRGDCRATFECAPRREGDRWFCTRPESAGGECTQGPLPTGVCTRPIAKCAPVRSYRKARGAISRVVAALAFGLVLVVTAGGARGSKSGDRAALLSPGPLSRTHGNLDCTRCHSAAEHAWLGVMTDDAGDGAKCLACHREPHAGSAQLAHGLDRSALHDAQTEAPACATCHPEHRGRVGSPVVLPDGRCQACHDRSFASFESGHPGFGRFGTHDGLTSIAFDHAGAKHQQVGCSACHAEDDAGGLEALRPFASACAPCHAGSIGRVDAPPVALGIFCAAPAPTNAEAAIVTSAESVFRAHLPPLPAEPALGTWIAATKSSPAAYLPSAHADPVVKRVLEAIASGGRVPTAEDDGGRCTSCHTVAKNDAGAVTVRWFADADLGPKASGAARFTKFSHRAHEQQSCSACHTLRENGFEPIAKSSCEPCHTRSRAGAACLLCHNYHAETFSTRPADAADPTVGPTACLGCHRHENAYVSWSKSSHARTLSADDRVEDAKAIAAKLGIASPDTDPRCARCHATLVGGKVVAGVSCEACHGAARDWLGVHADVSRPEREQALEQAGMTRPGDASGLAQRCYGCHVVADEALVEAGHLGGSGLELSTWTQGEVRHGFLDLCTRNEVATNREATAEHRRVLFVVGALTDLEVSLRALAVAKNPPYFEKMRDRVSRGSSRLAKIVETEPALAPRLGDLVNALAALHLKEMEGPLALDRATLLRIAVAAREEARQEGAKDGAAWAGLDAALPKRVKGTPWEPEH